MTSLLKNYAQNDTRLENVTLTGYISNNGVITGTPGDQHPAYAAIDLTKSKNFRVDTRVLTLRTDSGINPSFLLRIYISSSKPPSYNQNFDFDIFVDPPTGERLIYIQVYANKAAAENAQVVGNGAQLYTASNYIPDTNDDYSSQTGILSFKVLNNSIIFKSISPYYSL